MGKRADRVWHQPDQLRSYRIPSERQIRFTRVWRFFYFACMGVSMRVQRRVLIEVGWFVLHFPPYDASVE